MQGDTASDVSTCSQRSPAGAEDTASTSTDEENKSSDCIEASKIETQIKNVAASALFGGTNGHHLHTSERVVHTKSSRRVSASSLFAKPSLSKPVEAKNENNVNESDQRISFSSDSRNMQLEQRPSYRANDASTESISASIISQPLQQVDGISQPSQQIDSATAKVLDQIPERIDSTREFADSTKTNDSVSEAYPDNAANSAIKPSQASSMWADNVRHHGQSGLSELHIQHGSKQLRSIHQDTKMQEEDDMWVQQIHKGRPYYVHRITYESVWEKPSKIRQNTTQLNKSTSFDPTSRYGGNNTREYGKPSVTGVIRAANGNIGTSGHYEKSFSSNFDPTVAYSTNSIGDATKSTPATKAIRVVGTPAQVSSKKHSIARAATFDPTAAYTGNVEDGTVNDQQRVKVIGVIKAQNSSVYRSPSTGALSSPTSFDPSRLYKQDAEISSIAGPVESESSILSSRSQNYGAKISSKAGQQQSHYVKSMKHADHVISLNHESNTLKTSLHSNKYALQAHKSETNHRSTGSKFDPTTAYQVRC